MKNKKVLIMILGISLILPGIVNAATYNFKSYDVRKAYNEKKYNELNTMPSLRLNMYKDIYLKDMFETDYLGITEKQQEYISSLAEQILNDENYLCEETDTEEMCKIRKFHDWIKENFYYYNPKTTEAAKNIGLDINEYDNPYYVLTKNKITAIGGSHIVSRCNGFAGTLIALARSEGIPGMAVSGYYQTDARRLEKPTWNSNVTENTLSHTWAALYVDGNWIIVDANADCYNQFQLEPVCNYGEYQYGSPGQYTNKSDCEDAGYVWTQWKQSQKSWAEPYVNKFFNISAENLSDSHIIFEFRSGSKDTKYILSGVERTKLIRFLNITSNGISNGKRINKNYTTTDPKTWFAENDTMSSGDGYGYLYRLYWPSNKKIYGNLNLSNFTKLKYVTVSNNKLTELHLENCPSLVTVTSLQNQLKKVIVTGSKDLKLLSIRTNPTTYVKYTYGSKLRTAIIKANKGGTIKVRYSKSGTSYIHSLEATPKKGYKFKGWYNGTKKVSSKIKYSPKKTVSFTYTAKFKKK